MNEVLVFDLTGPMAHFRKYYTNTSALTYGFPPRTALMGLVAAVLGFERDSYYEKLDHGRYALAIKVPPRRLIQTVNYVRTKKEDLTQLRRLARVPGTQTPVEFLMPTADYSSLRFRVCFCHSDVELVREVAVRLHERRSCYPLYLGITECIASGDYIDLVDLRDCEKVSPGEITGLTSVLNAAFLKEAVLSAGTGESFRLIRERVPYSFDPGRMLRSPISVIYEARARPFYARLNIPVWKVPLPSGMGEETVAFLEE